ncbi:hypothetical protein FRC11_007600, partial [Ceratobasidium sp. 423]
MTTSRISLTDLFVTTTSIIFIYRTRTGLREHDGIFSTIWQIIWASATPPFILLFISLVNGYILKSGSQTLTVIAGGVNAKFCNLSLMINLIGQGHIRRKFEQVHPPELPTISASRTPGAISDPVFAIPMISMNAENVRDIVSNSFSTPDANHSDAFVNKRGEDGLDVDVSD